MCWQWAFLSVNFPCPHLHLACLTSWVTRPGNFLVFRREQCLKKSFGSVFLTEVWEEKEWQKWTELRYFKWLNIYGTKEATHADSRPGRKPNQFQGRRKTDFTASCIKLIPWEFFKQYSISKDLQLLFFKCGYHWPLKLAEKVSEVSQEIILSVI